jgi:hypothetical protein
MKFEFPLLTADQIEVKVKQVSANGVVLLLYKTARTDMELLDAVVGPMNWAVDYREIKGNLYCGIGITEDREHWVWKWDCGIESRADGDGNEKKGEASDAFKRAGFKWGVGRELYTSPFTFAKVETEKNDRGQFVMKDKFARFTVKEIGYEGRSVSRLVITDNRGQVVFSFGKGAMPVGSAESAQEAGNRKLKEIEQQMKQARESDPASPVRSTATDEQIAFIRENADGKTLKSAMEAFGPNMEKMTQAQANKLIARIKKANDEYLTASSYGNYPDDAGAQA